MPLLLRALDVYVLASKFEPYGVAVLEAKAAGTAIASTNVNELPEIIRDGVSGLLAPAGCPEALAELFLRLAGDPELRRRLGEQAQREAQEENDIQVNFSRYQQLYDQARGLLARSVPPPP